MKRLGSLLGATTLLILATPVGAAAEEPAGTPLSLADAVATTLARDPEIAQAAERVASQRAALLEARGLFDRQVSIRTAIDYKVQALSPGRRKAELDRRLRLELPPPVFDEVSQRLIDGLPIVPGDRDPASFLFPDCTQATTFFVIRDERDEVQSVLCFDANDNLLGVLGRGPNGEAFNAFDLSGLFSDLSAIDERLDAFVRAQLSLLADELRVIAIALRQTAASLRLQRNRIGDLPLDQENIKFDWGLDWAHRFRGGSRLVSTIDLSSTEDNYKGKPLSPGFGDSFVSNDFRTTFGLGLDLPLGRGGGRRSAEAPVRSAERNLDAAEALYEHVASQRVLAALEAYWDAAAAAKRLLLLEESNRTQQRLLLATEELVKADQIPRVDLTRNRARSAEVSSQVATARQALAVARLELARAIGLESSSLVAAPDAVDGYGDALAADPFAGLGEEDLARLATEARRDLLATRAIAEAGEELAVGAKSDLRPEVALSLNLSYNAFHESFRDRFYDFEGFWRALEDKYAGPTYGMALRVRLPVGNRAARGRLLQAESSLAQSRISEEDLRRTIRLRVHELARTLVQAKAELVLQKETLGHLEETHAASLERHKAGDLSVIDTLTTEQQLTSARLQLVDAERRYLSRMAQLRFEIGALVELPPAQAESADALSARVVSARLKPLGEPVL